MALRDPNTPQTPLMLYAVIVLSVGMMLAALLMPPKDGPADDTTAPEVTGVPEAPMFRADAGPDVRD